MSATLLVLVGVALLWLVWSDRGAVRRDWKEPARWWKPGEYWAARSPSQPLNVVLGTVLGLGAVVYGLIALLG